MKLRGNCPAKVDDKGRLKIPAVFLEELKEYGTSFYITSPSGESARIYPLKVWSEIEDKLAGTPNSKEKRLADSRELILKARAELNRPFARLRPGAHGLLPSWSKSDCAGMRNSASHQNRCAQPLIFSNMKLISFNLHRRLKEARGA